MTTVAILSTGPSMSRAVADSVRHLPRIAINLAYLDAPDAEALVANDTAFWTEYPEALKFAGRKFSSNKVRGTEQIISGKHCWCSGVLALEVAVEKFDATKILMFGMDFQGGHYFGKYKGRCLKTSTRWHMHRQQFSVWAKAHRGIEAVNCTVGSALDVFPIVPYAQAA